ncbi:MAG TPA: hypothetical protein PLF48_04610 [Chitinophagales bacterium]|nr:hypothetical protein [Chitinophagales bacterium]
MKNMNRLTPEEITNLIQEGLNLLIKGFENIGFRRKTNERLQLLEDQVALLSKKLLASEES